MYFIIFLAAIYCNKKTTMNLSKQSEDSNNPAAHSLREPLKPAKTGPFNKNTVGHRAFLICPIIKHS